MDFFSRQGLKNYLPGLALNRDPPDLCLLSSRITGGRHQRGLPLSLKMPKMAPVAGTEHFSKKSEDQSALSHTLGRSDQTDKYSRNSQQSERQPMTSASAFHKHLCFPEPQFPYLYKSLECKVLVRQKP
jgi:hypothetical protein